MLFIFEKFFLNDLIFEFGSYIVYYVGIDVGVNYIFKFVKYRGVMWIICRLLVMIVKN